jgi:uncharacterized protein involved in type VI secretion and phage assembly
MHRMVHTIRQIARHEMAQQVGPALGIVKSIYTAQDYSCTVKLRETGMVLPKVPLATDLIGLVAPPREDDLVVIVFLNGDIHAPVIVGRLYNETVAPPTHDAGQVVTVLPGGEEAPDKRLEMRIETPGDGSRTVRLTLDGSVKVQLEIKDDTVDLQAGEARLKLTQTSSTDGKAELSVADSKVVIEQSGNVSVEATGTLRLKASQIEISADSTVKIAGQVVNLN